MARVGASVASSRENVEHVVMVRNMSLSHEDEISPAIVTNTEGEGESSVRCTFRERRGERSVLTVTLEMERRRFRKINTSLATTVKWYKQRVRNLEEKVDGEELDGVALLGELKRSAHEMGPLEYENKLQGQTTEGVLDSDVCKAGTSSRFKEWLLDPLEPQYVEPAMSVTQRFGVLCGRQITELKQFSVRTFESGRSVAKRNVADLPCKEKGRVWFTLL